MASMTALIRPARGRIIAGVCAGLAIRFSTSAWLIRIIFLLSMLLPGPQILIYLALWIIVPKQRG
jgi:phage shock protein PspC (stress-responsive transcriptional regulator)